VKIETDKLNNLTKTSSADCFQVRSVAKERFVRKLGTVSDAKMLEIEQALTKVLKIRG
jgi:mRNA interferase MazF